MYLPEITAIVGSLWIGIGVFMVTIGTIREGFGSSMATWVIAGFFVMLLWPMLLMDKERRPLIKELVFGEKK